ncbi:ATP-binding cassette domain-containing protein [Chthonobacter rhizosphaerae]|uniref:ATP-binding cassette domain-containing protein n=1 Tax=Chthonobacter rhizosphaerae TaxID=2735553 RepID=UPI0015EED9CE|nr:ATP-binding cassette domain-containing protein [Chthonobacter rhizosphaerae]
MTAPILEARGITKSYGHVRSLQGADISVDRGEVVALIGDNGAGKSTLTKILSGALKPDGGEIRVDGVPVTFDSPVAARRHGIETVYQDLSLALDLNPIQNLFLGRELPAKGLLGRLGFLDRAAMRQAGEEAFRSLSVRIPDMRGAVANFSGGQRQGVAVARALMWAKRLVFMDEPTAALGVAQTRNVLDLIRRVRDSGVSVVLISHSMPDVLAVSDRIVVLRHGRRVATFDAKRVTSDELVGAMTGTLELSGAA